MKQFKSFGAFATHLAKTAALGHEVTHHMAKTAGEEIQKTAKGEIGFYQTGISPFPDWAPLAESTEAEKARLGYEPDAPLLRTGEMRDSIEVMVEGSEAVVGTNDEKMKWHEYGTEKMPPRPVLGPAAHFSTKRNLTMIAKTTFAWLSGAGWKRPQRLK